MALCPASTPVETASSQELHPAEAETVILASLRFMRELPSSMNGSRRICRSNYIFSQSVNFSM